MEEDIYEDVQPNMVSITRTMPVWSWADMKENICVLPEKIKAKESEIFAAQQKIDEAAKDMKTKELFMFREVSSEKTADGKDAFSSEGKRDAETQKRLSTDLEYSALLKGSIEYSKIKGLATIELDYFKRELKSIELLLKAFDVEKNVR